MNKTRLTSTLAGVALAATSFAAMAQQASVQISGQVGAGLTLKNKQGPAQDSLKEMTDNLLAASFLRFSGNEDLGGGMRALFRLETGLALDTGNTGGNGAGGAKFFNRQSWVGLLIPNVGQITLGRQFHAATDRALRSFDVYNFAGSSLHVTPLALFGVNRYAANDNRVDNSIKYRAALPSGLEFGASIAAGEGVTGKSHSADVAYGNADYTVGALIVNFRNVSAVAGSVPEHDVWAVGGNAKLGAGRVYLSYFDSSLDPTIAGRLVQDNRIVDVGISWPVAPLVTVRAAYYDDKGTNLNGIAGRNGKKKTLVASAEYLLSKRTELYAAVFQNKFSDGYLLEAVNLNGLNRINTVSSVTGYSGGIRHSF